jgi:hypothetical protein
MRALIKRRCATLPARPKKRGSVALVIALFVIPALSLGRGGLAAERTTSNKLEQVTLNMLDTAAVSMAMTSFVQSALIARAANTRQAEEVERMFPGFNGRVRSRVAMKLRDTILHRIQDLREQYENLLRASLTPDEISELLQFQEDPIFPQLGVRAFGESLNTGGSNSSDVARRTLSKMLPQQRELTARFLETDAGKKIIAVGPQLEALKSKWQQDVLDEVASTMSAIGDAVLREYDQRPHGQ